MLFIATVHNIRLRRDHTVQLKNIGSESPARNGRMESSLHQPKHHGSSTHPTFIIVLCHCMEPNLRPVKVGDERIR